MTIHYIGNSFIGKGSGDSGGGGECGGGKGGGKGGGGKGCGFGGGGLGVEYHTQYIHYLNDSHIHTAH